MGRVGSCWVGGGSGLGSELTVRTTYPSTRYARIVVGSQSQQLPDAIKTYRY